MNKSMRVSDDEQGNSKLRPKKNGKRIEGKRKEKKKERNTEQEVPQSLTKKKKYEENRSKSKRDSKEILDRGI